MRRSKELGLTSLVLLGLLIGSGVAWAQEEAPEVEVVDTEQAEDTLFNFGYDILHHFFGWNLSALDGLFDCSLGDGEFTLTYGAPTADGSIPVDNLEDEVGVVTFPDRPEDQLAEGLEPAGAPAPYTGAEGECGLSGGDVTGPAGQVNHGMFMKLFNRLYQGSGRGCVARFIAQSELGKGDQQVGPEGDPDYTPIVGGETGVVDFESVEADCEHGNKKPEVAESEVQGNGRPEHAGKPEDAGKPDHAGKPEGTGKPDHAGKPDNPGRSAPGNDE